MALWLLFCDQNERYKICDTLHEGVISWALVVGPVAAIAIAGLTLSRRTVLIAFGVFAAAGAATVVLLTLAL